MKKLKPVLQNLKIDFKFRLYQLKLESIVYIPILIYAIVLRRFYVTIICVISFLLIRPATPTTFHFNNVPICVKTSSKLWFVGVSLLLVLPYNISLCLGILLALYICIELYNIQYSLLEDFNLETCTREELVERCRLRFKRDVEYKTERAIKHFIEKLPHDEIDINPRASEKERERMRKLLK